MTSETREEIAKANAEWDAAQAACVVHLERMRTLEAGSPEFRIVLHAYCDAQTKRFSAWERKFEAFLTGVRESELMAVMAGGAL